MGAIGKVERGRKPDPGEREPGRWPDEPVPSEAERRRVAVELVRDYEGQLRASARRVSICRDDAEDAVQRGIEILLSKAPTGDARRLLPWARTVVRNEALAIRRSRERTLARPAPARDDDGAGERDWVAELPADSGEPSDLVARREKVERGREALAALKPDELKALTQLAQGYSYAEIGSMNGWTRTKVNRCLAEGRARLRTVVRDSETGVRCTLIEPLISACVDGELEETDLAAVRNHLAVCGTCRATLREYRSITSKVAALLPAGPVVGEVGSRGPAGRLAEWADGVMAAIWSRAGSLLPGQDAALGTTLASGGLRGAGAAGLAKLAALCAGTAGGAAACVAVGILPMPVDESPKVPPVGAIERKAESRAAPFVPMPDPEPVESQPDKSDRPSPRPAPTPVPDPPEPVAAEFAPEGAAVDTGPTPMASPSAPAPSATASQSPSRAVAGEFQP